MRTAYLFDLDGTVSKHELLPIIAKAVDLEDEFRTLTELTINGTIPFESSFRLRFAMLRAIPVAQVRNALADIELDKNIVGFIRNNLENCFIVTGNLYPWISHIVAEIGCGLYANDAENANGQLIRLKPLMRKSEPVFLLRDRFDRVVAIGDGANDVPMFEVADIGVAYGGVHMPFTGLYDVADYAVFDSETLCRLLTSL